MEMTHRLLLVDDDVELCKLVTRFLAGEGFSVDTAGTGRDGLERARTGAFALVILDVTMPGMNGLDVLRDLRAQASLPVLMLTARGDARDRVLGLELGADDYLPKPFDPDELAARIRAILRRAARTSPPDASPLVVGDLTLDPAAREVRRAGAPVALTTAEFDLLASLLRTPGQPVERDTLTRTVLGRELTPFDRCIDTHASNLRRKLGPYDDGSERIKSLRGVGYLYAPRPRL